MKLLVEKKSIFTNWDGGMILCKVRDQGLSACPYCLTAVAIFSLFLDRCDEVAEDGRTRADINSSPRDDQRADGAVQI